MIVATRSQTFGVSSPGSNDTLESHMESLRIAVISEFNPDFPPHPATNVALQHSARALGVAVEAYWLDTEPLESVSLNKLEPFDAFWCAPGSPYTSLSGALRAIRFAREKDRPFVGTCGGFQHVVLEFARNVLGFRDAQHAEYDPYASELFITPLSCSLAGQVLEVQIESGSIAATSYGAIRVQEEYYCNFGLNPEYQALLDSAGLRVTRWDDSKEARIIELPKSRFYLASLFVPQMRSTPDHPHPLITSYLQTAIEVRELRNKSEPATSLPT